MNEDLLAAVQGRWRILAVEEDGQRVEGQPADELFAILRGDEFRVESHGQYFPDDRPSRFRCDPKRHRFDFLDSTGVVESPGIYCLDGMQLQICAALRVLSAGPSLPSRPPTSFVTTNGSGWRLWVMHRAAALRHGGRGVGGGVGEGTMMKTLDEKHLPQNRKALLHCLRRHGWEAAGVDDSEADWALDVKWIIESTRENKGATLALWFFKFDGAEDGMNRVVATPPDASQPNAYSGEPAVDFNARRFQAQLPPFMASLHACRTSGRLGSES